MNQVFTVYSVFFLTTSLVSFFVAFLAWQRRSVKGAIELAWLMIAAATGAFFIIFETAAPTTTEKIFWAKLEYIGGLTTPVLYLIFVLRFIGKDKFITLRNVILLFVVPAITLIFTLTNEKHYLIWSGFSAISGKTNLMEYYHGTGFWIGYIAYCYLMLFLASVSLIVFIINHSKSFRSQGWIVLTGGLFPWLVSVICLTVGSPVKGLDMAPVSIILSGILAAYAIFYFHFLDLVPVARETLVEILPDGIVALDGQDRIQDINEAALEFLGIKNKNVIGLPVESSGATTTPLLNVIIDRHAYDKVAIRIANAIKTYSIIKQPIRNQTGSRLVVIRDISNNQRAESALLESENQKAAILKAIPDLLVVFNKNGDYLDVYNENESRLIVNLGTLIGKNISDLFPQEVAKEAIGALKKSLLTREVVPFSYSLNINGKMEFFEARLFPTSDDKVLAIVRDITDLKDTEAQLIKAKEQAEESDTLKSAFLANMSHEIRTPMNGILGFTELLREADLTEQHRKEYLDIIKMSGDRLINIINDIIDISKIESKQMKVYISNTDINEQIEAIYNFFKPEAEAKGIHLSYMHTLSSEQAVIKTDCEKIFAILTNLVKNAIKFTLKGSIEIGYKVKDKLLEFYVKDTGMGINPEHKEIIFERFRQGTESLTRNYEGTGLGLSISKAYTEMLNGKIWFESEQGKGSVFYFTIPLHNDQVSANLISKVALGKQEVRNIKRLEILIAEDDETSQMYITKLVEPFGKKILKAKTGAEAVSACIINPDIDLILMDIKMPGMDGIEATRRIREFNNEVIIIAQTAFGLKGDKERILEAGCNDYISKPVDSTLLVQLLQKYFK